MTVKSLKMLLNEALQGNKESYRITLNKLEDLVRRFYANVSEDEVEEIVSKWFLEIVEHEKYTADLNKLYNAMKLDASRRKQTVLIDNLSDTLVEEYDIDYDMDSDIVRSTLFNMINNVIRPRERQAIMMYYFSEPKLTLAEVGNYMGISNERARVLIAKGLRKMRNARKLMRNLYNHQCESVIYNMHKPNIDLSNYVFIHKKPDAESVRLISNKPEEESPIVEMEYEYSKYIGEEIDKLTEDIKEDIKRDKFNKVELHEINRIVKEIDNMK